MSHPQAPRRSRPALHGLLLTACLVSAALSVHASPPTPAGFSVEVIDQGNVHIGMTEAEVLAAVGTPAGREVYRLSHTTTWRYRVPSAGNLVEFQVDFGQDGKVRSARQVILPAG